MLDIHLDQTFPESSQTTSNWGSYTTDDMWRPSLFLAAALAVPSQALHFFIDGAVQKCFFEELPKDTLVVGMRTTPIDLGH